MAIVATMEPQATVRAIVPYGFDRFGPVRAAPAGRAILFVAGFGHPPNEEAVRWFVSAVLPLIRARVPEASLAIVGSNPPVRTASLVGEDVTLHANVSDDELAAWYAKARVAVVPLRCGAGVKLKVVEALREGSPLVTTPVGAQGLPGIEHIVTIEDDAAKFAAAVCDLLESDTLWEQRSAAQIAYAAERFQTEAVARSLLDACGIVIKPGLKLAA